MHKLLNQLREERDGVSWRKHEKYNVHETAFHIHGHILGLLPSIRCMWNDKEYDEMHSKIVDKSLSIYNFIYQGPELLRNFHAKIHVS